jgi:flavodoxin
MEVYSMKILLVYYSRTNNTRKISEEISTKLNCDIEEIRDLKERSGKLNYLKYGYEAIRSKETQIEDMKNDPSDYDLVIVGTPVWASTMATPVLTYLNKNKNKIKDLAILITFGGSEYEKTTNNIEKLCGKRQLHRCQFQGMTETRLTNIK